MRAALDSIAAGTPASGALGLPPLDPRPAPRLVRQFAALQIGPIVSALVRSKTALLLLGAQIALTLAIMCNALFIIGQRLSAMQRPSGVDEANSFQIVSTGFGVHYDVLGAVRQDLRALRELPGVAAATPINRVPMGIGGWSTGASLHADQKIPSAQPAIYFVDERGLDALGVQLSSGRNFRAGEIGTRTLRDVGWPPQVIVTRALAQKLFPGSDALGRQIYLDATPTTIIGVIERLQAPWVGRPGVEESVLVPQITPYGNEMRYLVRAQPGRLDDTLRSVEATLTTINSSRVVRGRLTMQQVRSNAYAGDRAMSILLGLVIACLLAVTALGIAGMANFWVVQRTKQIGTRRALGATRASIVRYFLTENLVITAAGLVPGVLAAYLFNVWLMLRQSSPLLPWYYVAGGCLVLFVIGQLAVLGPAARAARVPPAVATRSV